MSCGLFKVSDMIKEAKSAAVMWATRTLVHDVRPLFCLPDKRPDKCLGVYCNDLL